MEVDVRKYFYCCYRKIGFRGMYDYLCWVIVWITWIVIFRDLKNILDFIVQEYCVFKMGVGLQKFRDVLKFLEFVLGVMGSGGGLQYCGFSNGYQVD